MNPSSILGLFPSLAWLWMLVAAILVAIVNISFALAVLADSQQLARHLRRRTFFVGGGIWAIATLLGGVFVAGIYWAIHHSSLRPQPFSDDSASTKPEA